MVRINRSDNICWARKTLIRPVRVSTLSEQAWQDHREREAVQTIYLPKVMPLVERIPHFSTKLE